MTISSRFVHVRRTRELLLDSNFINNPATGGRGHDRRRGAPFGNRGRSFGQASQDIDPDDTAAYVNAATVALPFSSIQLDAAPTEDPRSFEATTPRSLRDVMGCLVTGCVTTTSWEGEDVAMTANFVTLVSLEHTLILRIVTTARCHEAIIEVKHAESA